MSNKDEAPSDLIRARGVGGFDIWSLPSFDPHVFARGATEAFFARTYSSPAHSGLDVIAEKFLAEVAKEGPALGGTLARACFGIAGPVEGNVCRATNLPFVVDGRALSQRLGIAKVRLVNDFYAAALGSVAVPADKLVALGGGPRDPKGPVAVLGAGTGLGQAFLLWSPADGRHQVVPSEGGHCDFAQPVLGCRPWLDQCRGEQSRDD